MNLNIIRSSRQKFFFATLGSFGFVAVGYFLFSIEKYFVGAVTMIVFGAFATIGLFVALINPARLIITNSGITIRGNAIGEITWADIRSCDLHFLERGPIVDLTIRGKRKYLERRAKSWNFLQRLDGDLEIGHVVIDPKTLDTSAEDIHTLLNWHISKVETLGQ